MKKFKALTFLCLALLLIGCASYPVNSKLQQHERSTGYRFKNLTSSRNSDSLFVILTFSGGGTRASALSFGVLEELAKTEIKWQGESRRLLDEVDVISSVSGGSFTAAYYGLYGERLFSEFETKFLKRDVQGELTARLFSPGNWFRLASSTFDRIDLASEYYDEIIFDRQRFNDLLRLGQRPFIILNGTDMSTGARFEFTQDQFDLLCSDLSDFPVARAVAASSAFPILLTPITLKNYAGQCDYSEPEWVDLALHDRDIATRRFNKAVLLRSYLDSRDRPYIHLLDGGIADNIGLRGPLDAVASLDSAWSVLRLVNLEKVKKLIVITVNAKSNPDTRWDRKESAPGLRDMLESVTGAPIANYSFETVELLKESFKQWTRDARARRECEDLLQTQCPQAKIPGGELHEVDFYSIVVEFDAIQDASERDFFKNLPTNFSLPPHTVDRLRQTAAKLLVESSDYQKLLRQLAQP